MKIDVGDESLIDAEPAVVLKALINEAAGRTHWWLPFWQAETCGDIPPDQVGGIFDVTVRKGITVKFRARVVEISDKNWRVKYIGGAYRGYGDWSFEPKGGKTHLRFHWQVQPKGWLGWLLRFAPSSQKKGTSHHEVMNAGFAGLSRYLNTLK
jgi:hypothetical protein